MDFFVAAFINLSFLEDFFSLGLGGGGGGLGKGG